MKKTNALILFFILTLSFVLPAQRSYLTFSGVCVNNKIPVAGAKIKIVDSGAIVSECISDEKGKFKIKSLYNKLIYLVFEKEGYVSQRIYATTRLLNMGQYDMIMNINFNMIAQPTSDSILVFKEPVAKILFDYEAQKFSYDIAYATEIKPKLDAFLAAIEKINAALNTKEIKKEDSLILK